MLETKIRHGWVWVLLAVALLVTMSASVGMYLLDRAHADASHSYGVTAQPNRVDMDVFIGHIDPAAQTATVSVRVHPRGNLATATGSFRSTATLYTPSAIKQDPIMYRAGQPISTVEVTFALRGMFTDYPFDRYATALSFAVATSAGATLPSAATVASGDNFFKVVTTSTPGADPGAIDLAMTAKRSTPTLVFAIFMMVLMLGLAVAAAVAGYFVLRWRRGLLWPACSMMGALLFALVPLRNAVPGGPPIGSVIDFLAFFPTEGVISVALVASVVIGYHVEIANEQLDKAQPDDAGASEPAAPARDPADLTTALRG